MELSEQSSFPEVLDAGTILYHYTSTQVPFEQLGAPPAHNSNFFLFPKEGRLPRYNYLIGRASRVLTYATTESLIFLSVQKTDDVEKYFEEHFGIKRVPHAYGMEDALDRTMYKPRTGEGTADRESIREYGQKLERAIIDAGFAGVLYRDAEFVLLVRPAGSIRFVSYLKEPDDLFMHIAQLVRIAMRHYDPQTTSKTWFTRSIRERKEYVTQNPFLKSHLLTVLEIVKTIAKSLESITRFTESWQYAIHIAQLQNGLDN